MSLCFYVYVHLSVKTSKHWLRLLACKDSACHPTPPWPDVQAYSELENRKSTLKILHHWPGEKNCHPEGNSMLLCQYLNWHGTRLKNLGIPGAWDWRQWSAVSPNKCSPRLPLAKTNKGEGIHGQPCLHVPCMVQQIQCPRWSSVSSTPTILINRQRRRGRQTTLFLLFLWVWEWVCVRTRPPSEGFDHRCLSVQGKP